ncbi:hypothetical protein [Prauserella halophila]|uniref:hypothetical protein n=1 Tax=Prauserella halophila TaxID=185641 RepID=UPI0020A348AA|nr:hypothetical protein [Prauserella halophila]
MGAELLAGEDPQLHGAMQAEHADRESTLSLTPDAAFVEPSVLACSAGVTRPSDQLATEVPVRVERLAADRAREVFGADYANVLPGSVPAAVTGVLDAFGHDVRAALDLREAVGAGHDAGVAGHQQARHRAVADLVDAVRPPALLCGGPYAPATMDYERLRAIADGAGALLIADVTATAGEIAIGEVQSPVGHAHVTVVGTDRRLFGPRGAIVLTSSRDGTAEACAGTLTWSWPGSGELSAVAGKARALDLATTRPFRETTVRIRSTAAALSDELAKLGGRVSPAELADHTIVLEPPDRFEHVDAVIDVFGKVGVSVGAAPKGVAGSAAVALGSTALAQRGFGPSEIREIAELLDAVISAARPDGSLDESVRGSVAESVRRLLSQFPIPSYVPVSKWEAC